MAHKICKLLWLKIIRPSTSYMSYKWKIKGYTLQVKELQQRMKLTSKEYREKRNLKQKKRL